MRMKHLNLLLFASSMMFVAPAYGQDYKRYGRTSSTT